MNAKQVLNEYYEKKKTLFSTMHEIKEEILILKENENSTCIVEQIKNNFHILYDEVLDCLNGMHNVFNLLSKIPLDKGNEKIVLHLRYIKAYSLNEICDDISTSLRTVNRYHEEGLKIIQNILDKENERKE